MTTRMGFQYAIQSDGGGLRDRNDPKKGEKRGKIPSIKEFTQGSAISQRQVLEIPIISEPELELNMSNSNREKSHSYSSNRHIHEPVEAVLHGLQGQILGNGATNAPRND
ncbi:hypothetical protein O181_086160 [Austropuccinia psidii MF-1]|uniref:Uncharacterized protein n=1 Tax=Austropuccinia psidii MF-1 TaxID=1389203 RepID=A0A9Q3IN66_9BASI|nr:hypothetical protein [Austropuccinia psidii MF-1]